ncbi:hypothetical protein H4R34_004815 [Dimargaris verticillata]|uniref:Metallo-dependent phosphatase-like protein n=1 Tax=Dimargaris verticillata TaxID=2761393 RepID=A0A9W8E7R5_9FUNG|nr:hypothetical protein H4R34_004815 [Dimargaris verticillata]
MALGQANTSITPEAHQSTAGSGGAIVRYNYQPHQAPVTENFEFQYVLGDDYHALPKDTEEIRFVFTNDIHSHDYPFNKMGVDCNPIDLEEGTCYGGAARRKTIIDALRRGHKWTYVLEAGDLSPGHPVHGYYRGALAVKVMNHIKYDAMTLGNHEFDNGIDHLVSTLKSIDAPIICANLDMSNAFELSQQVEPYTILKGPRSLQIGVIGLTTNTTGSISKGASSVTFLDPAPVVQRHIDELKTKHNIHVIVALSHNGYTYDKEVATNTQGLLAIFGGHSHTYLSVDPNEPGSGGEYPTIVRGKNGQDVYIVQAKKFGEYVGFLDLTVTPEGRVLGLSGQPIHITMNIPEDPGLKHFTEEVRKPMERDGGMVIGEALIDMYQEHCKGTECPLANMVTDAMLQRSPLASIAMINEDGIRTGIRQGPIKLLHLFGLFPMNDELVTVRLSGRAIRGIITGVLTQKNQRDGQRVTCFAHYSGLRVEYSRADQKLLSIQVKTPPSSSLSRQPEWTDMKDAEDYTIVTFKFLANAGDHLLAKPVKATSLNTNIIHVMSNYLQSHKELKPEVEGRLVYVN